MGKIKWTFSHMSPSSGSVYQKGDKAMIVYHDRVVIFVGITDIKCPVRCKYTLEKTKTRRTLRSIRDEWK